MGDIIGIGLDVLGIETGSQKAARGAAEAQQESSAAAIAEQRRQFDISQAQATPFREAGLGALTQKQALLGLSGREAQQAAFQQFQESPGQAFLRERGMQAATRQASALGGLGGGNIREELVRRGTGFAQQDLQNQLSRLGGIAGQGQAVTQNIAQLGAGAAGQIGSQLQAGGQAQASGILGAQQAQSQFAGDIGAGLLGGGIGAMTPGVGFGRGALAGLARF